MFGGNDYDYDEKRTSNTTADAAATAAATRSSAQEEEEEATTAFKRQQKQQEQEKQEEQLAARRLKRVETDLRIALILKNDLETKLKKTQKELIEAQTRVYTTWKKHEKIMNYVNWLDYEYQSEEGGGSSDRRVVSTKFIRENLL